MNDKRMDLDKLKSKHVLRFGFHKRKDIFKIIFRTKEHLNKKI